jgi:hypothetical protein
VASSVGGCRRHAGWVAEGGEVSCRAWNPKDLARGLRFSKELARRLLMTDHGHVLGWRSGAEGRVGVMGLDAEEGAGDEFSPAMDPWW